MFESFHYLSTQRFLCVFNSPFISRFKNFTLSFLILQIVIYLQWTKTYSYEITDIVIIKVIFVPCNKSIKGLSYLFPSILHTMNIIRPATHKHFIGSITFLITAEIIKFLKLTIRIVSIILFPTTSDKVKQHIYTSLGTLVIIADEIPKFIILKLAFHLIPFHCQLLCRQLISFCSQIIIHNKQSFNKFRTCERYLTLV